MRSAEACVLRRIACHVFFIILLCALAAAPAGAELIYQDNDGSVCKELNLPFHCWQDNKAKPTAVLIALHGLGLDGNVFEPLARVLAPAGFITVAPDLRGFGHWYASTRYSKAQRQVDYHQAAKDICGLVDTVHEQYPDLPIFMAGESMGVTIALKIADTRSDALSGLVLSAAPVVKHHFVSLRSITNLICGCCAPHFGFDMTPYVKRYLSEDPQITSERLSDPHRRQRLSMVELLKTNKFSKQTLNFAYKLSPSIPVLILQGTADRVVKPRSATKLARELKSSDKSLEWFPRKGHLLLETSYIKPDVKNCVTGWLEQHASTENAIQQGISETTR
jgi:alpha-beta hydrolase superfamily lysophospholipase